MRDVNNLLANAASQWRTTADNLERQATLQDGEAARLDERAPDMDMGRVPRAEAAAARAEAAWLRLRASYADKGQFLINPQRPPGYADDELQGAAARAGRIVCADARQIAGIDLAGTAG